MSGLRTRVPAVMAAFGFAAAVMPLGAWYVRRMADHSDEPLGVAALAAALVLAWAGRDALRGSNGARRIALVLLGAYGVAVWAGLPPLLRAVPALGAVACWTGIRHLPGPTMLLGLSLPVVASLQFYLGYPMRLFAAGLSAGLLNLLGVPVERAGTRLLCDGAVLGVDAPCSGIRMLWMSCFFGAVVAGMLHLPWRPSIALVAAAGVSAVLANSLRATLLFFPEAGLWHLPPWCHEGAGLMVHVMAMAALLCLARRLQPRHHHPVLS